MKVVVRCEDRMVFEIDPITLDPKSQSVYDAYCYTDPAKDTEYVAFSDWVILRNIQWDKQRQRNGQ